MHAKANHFLRGNFHFFFWGFMAASNGIFIPFCKTHFNLSQFQSQLIDSTFYGGYFIGSVLLVYLYLFLQKRFCD
jgi:FHS family L-fucose permease-like MFS transporter